MFDRLSFSANPHVGRSRFRRVESVDRPDKSRGARIDLEFLAALGIPGPLADFTPKCLG